MQICNSLSMQFISPGRTPATAAKFTSTQTTVCIPTKHLWFSAGIRAASVSKPLICSSSGDPDHCSTSEADVERIISSSSSQQGSITTRCSSCHAASQSTTGSRRLVLQSLLAPLLVLGSDDATTIVNSVLSAYGLPTLKATAGFKLYDEFDDDFVFEYPRSWVSRPNTLRKGVYVSDFQTADKLAVEELELPADGDVTTAAVAAAVSPGGKRVLEDATLTMPAKRLIKSQTAELDGQEYLYLEFPSETTTRSGYNIKRKNLVAAAVKRDKLYMIAASARSDQYDEEKKRLLQHCVQSFRLR